jgi:hypothetical protein
MKEVFHPAGCVGLVCLSDPNCSHSLTHLMSARDCPDRFPEVEIFHQHAVSGAPNGRFFLGREAGICLE